MALNADVAAQFPADVVEIYGEDAVYHVSATAVDSTIKVVADRNSRGPRFESNETFEREMMEFVLRVSDVATPADGKSSQAMDYLTFESTKWYVIQLITRNVGGLHRVLCSTKAFREG